MDSPENNKHQEPELKGQPDGPASKIPAKYKFRELKVHSSDEWMSDATKKYRKVYDRSETTFMRVEFSFFNKLFDEADWEASLRLKCFHVAGSQKTELCNLEQKRNILKDENVVYIRQAWGNATQGAYWFKGIYMWEAFIDEVKVGETEFYLEDVGATEVGNNPYFEIGSIKLFEGDKLAGTLPEKKYLKKFSQNETRFVWVEFNFKNKAPKDYLAEIFFNFYDSAGQTKGRQSVLKFIPAATAQMSYSVSTGWGLDTPGIWKDDSYTLDIVFMDTLIATVPFEVGTVFETGDVPVVAGLDIAKQIAKPVSGANKNLDDLLNESLAELNSLTGMNNIKNEVNELVKLVRFYQETGKDILNKFSLHTVFTGNPGTGKTTVARILSKIYKGLGILEKGHLVEVDREGLVAGYVGQTAIKTGEKVNEAMGGILFIDEAYSLANGSGSQYDFGGESIQVILKRMEDNRGKLGVIVAGYTDNMHEFISSNPGLRSRFDKNFYFEDYSPAEMFAIALSIFDKEDVKPDEASQAHLKNYFEFIYLRRDKNFGNARTVRQVVGESVKNQHLRLASMKKQERTKELMETIILQDVAEFEIKETKTRPTLGFKMGEGK